MQISARNNECLPTIPWAITSNYYLYFLYIFTFATYKQKVHNLINYVIKFGRHSVALFYRLHFFHLMIYCEKFYCSKCSLKRLFLLAHIFHCIVLCICVFPLFRFINNFLMNTLHKFVCVLLIFSLCIYCHNQSCWLIFLRLLIIIQSCYTIM